MPLEVTDILPNLQTGLINAVPLPPSIALAIQVDNAAPNMLDLNWVPLVGAAIMTKNKGIRFRQNHARPCAKPPLKLEN